MVGKVDYSSVPTTVDLENNSNQKKYTINRPSGDGLVISKPLCALMTIGALLLAILAGLIVFFLVPRYCNGQNVDSPEALTTILKEVDERLPRSIEPSHYRIQIVPSLQNSTTTGSVVITLTALEDTTTIVFHLRDIEINKHSVNVKSKNTDSIEIADQEYLEGQKYKITLKSSLKKGEEYQLGLKFQGELNGHLQGFYKSQYTDANGQTRYAASTQFSPTDARRAFPCFDEPAFKAKFNISLARPANMKTLSNMKLQKSDIFLEQNEANWYWDHYDETPKMSTYLVAFILSDLEYRQTNDLIKIWSRKALLSQTEYAGEIAPKVLKYFENYFNIKFPLPKIDIVAVPEFGFSAMENWGLLTFRESSLLYDEQSSTIEDKRTIATVVSHEIVHQWFGNLVTPKWWNDLWLKEGFATYLEYLGVDHAEPRWNILHEFLPSETEKAMEIDALESSRPISFEVINSRQIKQAFDEISYAKGACIIRMMNHFLGETTFKNGLTNFLQKYKYSNADRNDLFESLTEEAHKSNALHSEETVKIIMDTWTERAGFPVITAIADYKKNTLTMTQKRFLFTNMKDEKSTWWVPISYTSDKNPDFISTRPTFWLRGESEITENVNFTQWYLLNINQTGYFIVNYDERNWRALIKNVINLTPLIRAQLISDSMDLARANLLDYDIPLRLIAKMVVNDQDVMFVPTLVVFNKLKFLSDILSATPTFGLFEEYHKAIFDRTYRLVGFDDNIDDYLTKRIRQTVLEWSCRSPDSSCAHQSMAKFRNWMTSKTSVSPNLREIVYCTAIREGGHAEWDFAYQQYLETNLPSEKIVLLDALGCTKEAWLLTRYVHILIDENSSIRIQDADRVFESVARNQVGTSIAFDFLRKNWNELLSRYGDGFNILEKMVKSLAAHMNTEFQLFELERFRDSVTHNISTTTGGFDSAIETLKANVDWMKKNYQQVEDWLKKHKDQYAYL